ncbi:hypothetical protein IscW_ISCW004546, partial [Ixodes scapularis]
MPSVGENFGRALLAYVADDTGILFELSISTSLDQMWVASGLSKTLEMPTPGLVFKRTGFTDGTLTCSWHRAYATTVHQTSFDTLKDKYHILMASGLFTPGTTEKRAHLSRIITSNRVDLKALQTLHSVWNVYFLIRMHGSLMITSWVLFVSVGILFARHFKNAWPAETLCDEEIWFALHRGLMLASVSMTVVALAIIFYRIGGWSSSKSLHPILGVISSTLGVLQVRSESVATIFLATGLDKARLKNSAWFVYLLGAFVVFHVLVHTGMQVYSVATKNGRRATDLMVPETDGPAADRDVAPILNLAEPDPDISPPTEEPSTAASSPQAPGLLRGVACTVIGGAFWPSAMTFSSWGSCLGLLYLAIGYNAYPNGAPLRQCAEMRPYHRPLGKPKTHPTYMPQTGSAPYSVTADKQADQVINAREGTDLDKLVPGSFIFNASEIRSVNCNGVANPSGCGVTVSCLELPGPGGNIGVDRAFLTYVADKQGVFFELSVSTILDNVWIASGLSESHQMGPAHVVECLLNNDQVIMRESWNHADKVNTLITPPTPGLVFKKKSFVDGTLTCSWHRAHATTVRQITFDTEKNTYHILVASGPFKHGTT